ncbi:MAG: acyl-CoA synthetase [Pseudooceanicola sp.]
MRHPRGYAERNPDKVAYRMAGSGETLTYGALERIANREAHALRALGIGKAENLALLFENRLDFVTLCWAAQRAGIFYTAISHHLTVGEIAYIVANCGARVLVISDSFLDRLPELQAACPDVRIFVSGPDAPADADWRAFAGDFPETPIADEADGSDLLYSSGTTGRPKGIMRTFEEKPIDTIHPLLELLCKTMGGMDEDTVYLSPAPLYHAAPLRYTMTVLMLGGTVVLMEKFDAESMLRLIEEHRVTHTQVVPTMFVRMLKLSDAVRAGHDLSTLRVAYHAAAPCPPEIKRRMIDWWGPILIEYYAGSEGNGVTIATSEDWERFPGTVGKSMLGPIVIAGEDGRELPAGEIGAVYFDSGLPFEYRGDPDKTAGAFLRAGCSTLGDVGYVNEEGFLFLTDRASYTIISGGVNIYPQETEDTLICHPDVADVAVFGVPNEEMGEEVKAVVRLEPHAEAGPDTAAALIAWCRERLSHIKVPRSVEFRDDLPRTPTGKLVKRKLKDEYWTR